MKLTLAILWSVVLGMDIALCAAGKDPTWVSVFCPLSVVVLENWLDWISGRKR